MPSFNLKMLVLPVALALSTLALGGASCDKKSSANPESNKGALTAMDNSNKPKGPVSKKPIPGVDTKKLDSGKLDRFYRLVEELQSPCGKAHSLRTSLTQDSSCKRAPFAARYVIQMLDDEQDDNEVREFYNLKYIKKMPIQKFVLGEGVPHSGPTDAPVHLVEFYDYGCPACKQFAPLLDEAMSEFTTQAVMYYKQFPLPGHPQSKPAAQAALAAMKQGKFKDMHKMLFANSPSHSISQLEGYAQKLGLDMAKFKADMEAARTQVEADIAEGDKAKIRGTPTLFINGRQYEGLAHPTYIKMWIEEELEVNR